MIPQAVFFDLYETLVTEFDPSFVSGPTIAERLHIESEDFSREWTWLYERRMRGQIPDFPSTLWEIGKRLQVSPPEDVIGQLLQERLAVKKRPFQQIEAQVLSMLRRLREETTVKVGLITNATAEEVAAWDACPLVPFFDDVIISYQVGAIKPEAAIYNLACERLHVSPEHSCFIGDGGNDELVGVKGAGLRPYWATWFLDRWPQWKLSAEARERSAQFARLKTSVAILGVLQSDE